MKKILYMSTGIPNPTQTFVDREIRVLADSGYEIKTVSRVSPDKKAFSSETLEYYKDTLYLDQTGLLIKILLQFYVFLINPRAWLELAQIICLEKEFRSKRDRLRTLHHFMEAGFIYIKLKNVGIDHIHAHILNAPASIALFLSKLLRVPFSFTMHGSNIFSDPLMLGTKLRLCKKAVTISSYNKEYLRKRYGDELAGKIEVIHCGIDIEEFEPPSARLPSEARVLSVGRLIDVKGFSYLLEACQILKNKGIRLSCSIVGDGEDRDFLEKKAATLEVTDVVNFMGRQTQEEVKKLLHTASIFVLPCIVNDQGVSDGIPVSLMEAMSVELPVVSSRIVGIPELIEDGKEGFLVEQRNPLALASSLEFLLNDSNARDRMGKQGRRKIMQHFNIAHVPSQFYGIFN